MGKLNENETVQQRYDRLKAAGYGQAGGYAGDHMIRLALRIADGEGAQVYKK